MKTSKLFWLFLWVALPVWASGIGERFDKSEDAFFPPEFGNKLKLYKSFPALWWNFVILQGKSEANLLGEAHLLCQSLKSDKVIAQVECEQDPGQYLGLIEHWARDETVRKPFHLNWNQKINEAMAKASLPIPKSIFNVLRSDPFNTVDELRELTLKRLRLDLERAHGFFYDSQVLRVVIPVKFNFPPQESEALAGFPERLNEWCRGSENCSGLGLIGPHGSTLENKARIASDLESVSLIGVGVLLFTAVFLMFAKQQRMLWLFVPVGMGTLMSAAVTVLYFGKIHGLTLSFGTGIIGLTIDYGLHAAFNGSSPNLWKSNFLGFVTTLVCLVVLYFTQVPLLKQIIWFSIWGFVFVFGLFYCGRKPLFRYVAVDPWAISFNTNAAKKALVVLLLAGLFFALKLQPRMELRQFDYQSGFTKQMTEWIFQKTFHVPPLFQIQNGSSNPLSEGAESHQWANEHQIAMESINNYLPVESIQRSHLKSWSEVQCSNLPLEGRLAGNAQKIFEPYLERVACRNLGRIPLDAGVPRYIQHLESQGSWLRLWFPKKGTDATLIQERYSEALSLTELVAVFPRILSREMRIMLPLSLVLVFGILYLYYRRWNLAFLGLLPFATGLGLCLGAAGLFHLPLSFMSLIGLVMILGFSVDYAVFAIDAQIYHEDVTQIRGRTTGLIYAAASTVLGFLPLVFCAHPVLNHLGNFLVLGVLGTVVGTFWGIPAFFERTKNA